MNFTFFCYYYHVTILHPIENIFSNRDSLESPLSNGMLLFVYLSCFHSEISGLRKISSPSIIRLQFPNSDNQQKNVPNYDTYNKLHRKMQFQNKKVFFDCFSEIWKGDDWDTFVEWIKLYHNLKVEVLCIFLYKKIHYERKTHKSNSKKICP